MLALALFVTFFLVWWLALFIGDRSAIERLLWRFNLGGYLEMMAKIETAGERVRDLSLVRQGIPRAIVGVWLPPVVVIGGSVIAVLLGAPPVLLAVVGGGLLGVYGVFGEALLSRFGFAGLVPERPREERPWIIAGTVSKILLVFSGMWVLLTSLVSFDVRPTLMAVGGVVAGLTIISHAHVVAVRLSRHARRLHQPAFATETDPEAILFLRSFTDDDIKIRSTLMAGGLTSSPVPMGRVRFEELLVWMLQTHGRVIAIGRPGEQLPELGAARTYWPDDQWRDAVQFTANRCKAIVVIGGSTGGLEWELQRIRKWGLLGKTLVVLPPDPDNERSGSRLETAVQNLGEGGSALDEVLLAMWTGLRVTPDGTLVHFVSNGRDWASYLLMIVGFFSELRGRTDPLEHGAHARAWERINRISAQSTTSEEADRRWEQEGPFAPAQRQRQNYWMGKNEKLPRARLKRLQEIRAVLEQLWDQDRMPEAVVLCREAVAIADTPSTPGNHAYTLILLGSTLEDLGQKDDADIALATAVALARTATRRVGIGAGLTPPELAILALELRAGIALESNRHVLWVEMQDSIIDTADEEGNRPRMAQAELEVGQHLAAAGDADAALRRLNRALAHAVDLGDTDLESETRTSLSTVLSGLGRDREAADHVARCIALADQRGHPERSAQFRLTLARTFARQRDYQAALQCCTESLTLARRLAEQTQGNAPATRDVSAALDNIGELAMTAGDLDAARTAYTESLTLARLLAEQDLSNAQAARNLAFPLDRIGQVAMAAGDLDAARTAYTEMHDILRRLAEQDPTNAQATRDLSLALKNVGQVAMTAGDLDAARTAYTESLTLARRLIEQHPDNAQAARSVAIPLDRIGQVAMAAGDLDAARTAYTEMHDILRRLAEQDPTNAQATRDLSLALKNVGQVAMTAGDLDAARTAYTESLTLARRLAEQHPDNAQATMDLSLALDKVGQAAMTAGDLDAARTAYTESLTLARRLAEQDPTNAQATRDLSLALKNAAQVAMTAGDLDAARTAYTEMHGILRRAAEQDPSNAEAARDLTFPLDRIGQVAMTAGDLDAARTAYTEMHDILRRLAEHDPGNAQATHDLAVSLNHIAKVAMTAGDLDAARTAYTEMHDILRRAAEQDPSNAEAARDLTFTLDRIGQVAMTAGDLDAARTAYTEAHEILRRLAEQDPGNAQATRDLAISADRIRRVSTAEGELGAAPTL